MNSKPTVQLPALGASTTRRHVLKGMGAGAATVALASRAAPQAALAQPNRVEQEIGTGWTHVVGGGGSILFYNANTGAGLAGTLDENGWLAVERYTDFATSWQLVVATAAGSVLLVDPGTGQGAGGTITGGRWSYLTDYTDFAPWTHAVGTRDSVLLYDRETGNGAGGTLIDGQWRFLTSYDDFFTGYTHLAGSDDSVLLYSDSIGFGATGTLENGAWEWRGTYDDFARDWTLQVGAGQSLLLVQRDTGLGAAGFLMGGTWEGLTEYGDFSTNWTHVVSAGNGYVLFYDAASGEAGWGTLADGAWSYIGRVDDTGAGSAGLERLDELGRAMLAETGVRGFSVAIARNGNLVYANGFGIADPQTGAAVTADSRFRIASISKPITAAAIMTLVEAGQLSLDDTFFGADGLMNGRYVPNPFTPAYADITITHLLQHTAGAWSNAAPDPMYERPELDVEDLIDWVIDNRLLEDEPGTTFAYSNFGYCLLGRVIEEVSGQPYDAYVRTAVLDPCGITGMEIAGNTLAERRPGEVVYDGSNTPANLGTPYGIPVARMDAHGGWIGTATDLLRFATRVDGVATVPDILAGATVTTMATPSAANPVDGNPGYAMGWWINAANTWWHDGRLAGTQAFLVRANDGLCWAALANGNGIDLEDLVWGMIDQVDTWPEGEPL